MKKRGKTSGKADFAGSNDLRVADPGFLFNQAEQYDLASQFPEVVNDLGVHRGQLAHDKFVLPKRKQEE